MMHASPEPTSPWAQFMSRVLSVLRNSRGQTNPTVDGAIDCDKTIVSFFPNEAAQTMRRLSTTLPQLADLIAKQTAHNKMELPWLKFATFGNKRSTKNCLRTNENVKEISGVEGEHDTGEISFDDAVATMRQKQVRCIVYTSPSYVPGTKERWRVLAPLSRPYPPEWREKGVARLNGLFAGKLAGESFTLSQSFYFGHIDGAEYRVEVIDGDFFDLRDDLYAGSIFRDGSRIGDRTVRDRSRDMNGTSPVDCGTTDNELTANAGRGNPFLEASLPPELLERIRNGVPIGERSDQFFHTVKWLKDLDWLPGDIVVLLKKYPDGIASKYTPGNRVAIEVARAYGKPDKVREKPDDAATQQAKAAPKLILSSEEFTRDFVPPDYLWDGILLRGFVYSLTARTGDGKTAIMMALAAATALGKSVAGREVAQGKVLYFAGENPDDVRMRWIAMAEHFNFDADIINVHFIPGTFDITKLELRIRQEVAAIDGVIFVIVDTSPAYFQGENENDTVDMLAHAEMLRRLKDLPGNPTIIAACHPVKNAGNEALIPRGGGAFLNAVDGNLCAWKTDMVVTMHHQGKFRGVDFEPMSFELRSVTARKLLDSRGCHIPTVIARDLSKDDQRRKASEARSDEDAILVLLFERCVPTSSSDIAAGLHWLAGTDNHPNKSKVQRLLRSLTSGSKADRLVETDRDGAKLTKKGKAVAERLAAVREDARRPDETVKFNPSQPKF